MTFTKDQIIQGIVNPFVKALSFALSLINDKDLVRQIVTETQVAIAQVNVEVPPTPEEAVRALLAIADTVTDATPTPIDDIVVDAGEIAADFVFKRGAGFISIVKLLQLRKKAKKEAE